MILENTTLVGPIILVLSNPFKIHYKLWLPAKASSLVKDFNVSIVSMISQHYWGLKSQSKIIKASWNWRLQWRARWLVLQTGVHLPKCGRSYCQFLLILQGGEARLCRNECKGKGVLIRTKSFQVENVKGALQVGRVTSVATPVAWPGLCTLFSWRFTP